MNFPNPSRWLAAILCLLAIAAAIFFAVFSPRQVVNAQDGNPWQDVSPALLNGIPGERVITTVRARSLRLNRTMLAALLKAAPLENSAEPRALLPVPYPDGSFKTFRIAESPVMEKELADKFPEIKTYSGQSVEDPTATARFDLTPQGFHAMILSSGTSDGETIYVDPPIKGNADYYLSYGKSDLRKPGWDWQCDTASIPAAQPAPTGSLSAVMNGASLRTYRLAVAATGEYTAFHGGTVGGALAAIVTSINRVNQIYERDVAVRLVLIGNNNVIIYTNASTDPYTNTNGSTMLGQNQTNIDTVIGTANYDIGHVFSTGGGGVASLRSVCATGSKARGVTGSSAPVGDGFDIDYVAHEVGHQFGGNHTFNGTTSNCGGGNRSSSAAYEPGSGTTIMAYAGICGAEDLQPHSDTHFHVKSLEEIVSFITATATCSMNNATSNTLPTISAGSAYTIPVQTPFTLTAMGSDADNDALTYGWEQYNLGSASPPNTDNGNRPIFRSFSPTANAARTFPKLSDILNNTSTLGESLPTTTRTLTFQVTARDNRAGGGGVNSATVNIATTTAAGPFVVTSPNTALSWAGNSAQVVTWNIANTNLSPVNCTNVKITLSTDGGLTFPTVLAASVPNTGTANVTAPAVVTTQARVKVEAVGNVFFDVSNVNFTITASCAAITIDPATLPDANVGTAYNQTLTAMGGATPYTFAVATGALPNGITLTTSGALAGTLSGTPTVGGVFTFEARATDNNGCTNTRSYTLSVTGGGTLTANPNPIQLCNGAAYGATTLTWSAPAGTNTRLHVGSPTGAVTATGGATGTAVTGNWVSNGLQFFLVNQANNLVLASVTVAATPANCATGTLTANPNPIPLCNGTTVGATTLTWSAPTGTNTQLRIGSPTGVYLTAGGATGTVVTGNWVVNGLQFFLIDASNGATLATTTVTTTTTSCPSGGTLTLNPNPIQVCDGSGLGVTTLTWNAPGITSTQLRLNSPTGTLFSQGGSTGSATTGKWVTQGQTFYLVNAANGAVLATATATLTNANCGNGILTANPNPIQVCNSSGVGATVLTWNAPASATATQLRIGSPTGTLFSQGGASGTATTGAWVTNGLQFFLQDVTQGLPGTTISTTAVMHTAAGCRANLKASR